MPTETELFFEHDVTSLTEELRRLERDVPPDAEPKPGEHLERLTAAITNVLDASSRLECEIGDDLELLKDVQSRFRDEIRPWFDQSWFMERARSKPRGYPGDYVLLSAIYDNVAKSTGLGGLLDLYFLDQALAHGVRTRLAGVRRFLVKEVLRRQSELSILNVACGPAREYAEGFACEGQPVHLTCVDMDEQALEFVRERVAGRPGLELDMECVCYNALRMSSSKSTIEKFGRFDVIYSVGLCDYIPDHYMIRILQGWRESLQDGGVVYVAFKDQYLYDKAVYQWLVDWHFYQRSEDDCRRLYEEAGYDLEALVVERDGDGVIMNFIARLEDESVRRTAAGRYTATEAVPGRRGQQPRLIRLQPAHQ